MVTFHPFTCCVCALLFHCPVRIRWVIHHFPSHALKFQVIARVWYTTLSCDPAEDQHRIPDHHSEIRNVKSLFFFFFFFGLRVLSLSLGRSLSLHGGDLHGGVIQRRYQLTYSRYGCSERPVMNVPIRTSACSVNRGHTNTQWSGENGLCSLCVCLVLMIVKVPFLYSRVKLMLNTQSRCL